MSIRRFFRTTVVIAVVAATSFWLGRYTKETKYEASFPDPTPGSILTTIAPGVTLACSALAEGEVRENRLAYPVPTASAEAAQGVDKLSLKIAPDGKGIYLLTAAAVSIGVIDPGDPIPITESGADYLVASRTNLLNVDSVILNKRTLKGVWNFTGLGPMGMEGQSFVLSCH